jgi:hypothetical protein
LEQRAPAADVHWSKVVTALSGVWGRLRHGAVDAGQGQALAPRERETLARPGRELEHGMGSEPRGRTPWPHARRDREHAQLAVEEDCVDREAHERRVDRPGRLQQQAAAGVEARPSEQAAQALERRLGEW